MHIGGQWLEIEEPPSAIATSKEVPNLGTQKETKVNEFISFYVFIVALL